MFRSFRDKINNLIVLISRKSSSSKKTFHELEKLAYKDSAEFIYSNMRSAVLFTSLEKFWDYSLGHLPKTGVRMEFGVFNGHSINYFSNSLKKNNDNEIIYGFDSFEGLSEAWGGTNLGKGHFDRAGSLPKVNDNVTLIKGWIDETLPKFIIEKDLNNNKISFIHIDVDTYTPTKTIFESTQKHFQEGTLIIFDELLGYPGWKEHEYKALTEIINPNWEYEFIAFCEIHRKDFTSDHMRAALKITKAKK
jgi:hypothetical protein